MGTRYLQGASGDVKPLPPSPPKAFLDLFRAINQATLTRSRRLRWMARILSVKLPGTVGAARWTLKSGYAYLTPCIRAKENP